MGAPGRASQGRVYLRGHMPDSVVSCKLSIFFDCSHPSVPRVWPRAAQIMLGTCTLSTALGGRFYHPSYGTNKKSKHRFPAAQGQEARRQSWTCPRLLSVTTSVPRRASEGVCSCGPFPTLPSNELSSDAIYLEIVTDATE